MLKLPFLTKKDKTPDKFLTLTINATDVKALAFYYDQDSFRIIGSGKVELEKESVRNSVIADENDVVSAVNKAIEKATSNNEEPIDNIIIGLSTNICQGIMTTARTRRTEDSLIDQKEIKAFYSKISKEAQFQAQNEYLQTTGDPDIDLGVITTSNVYLMLDGNPVQKLENEEGNIVEASVFNAFTPNYHIESLKDISKKTKLDILALGSEMYALTQWLKENIDFVILDIAEESTNIAVVFGGGIVNTKSLNFGYMHFIEGISNKMGLTEQEAEKVLNYYLSGKLSSTEDNVVKSCLAEILEVWVTGVNLLFREFTNVKTFAPKVFVTGKGSQISEVINTLESEPWTQTIPFKDIPEFTKLDFSKFDRISDSTGIINSAEWINTASLSKIFEEIMK